MSIDSMRVEVGMRPSTSKAALALAERIADAVAEDEKPENGGCDVGAGLFGPNLSDLVREIADGVVLPVAPSDTYLQKLWAQVFNNAPDIHDGYAMRLAFARLALATYGAALHPAPPPECKTEGEKQAYAFGWWKALEAQRARGVVPAEASSIDRQTVERCIEEIERASGTGYWRDLFVGRLRALLADGVDLPEGKSNA